MQSQPSRSEAEDQSVGGPTRQGAVLVLSAADLARLDEERQGTGLSRSQWLTALARRRLGQVRQFDQHDRYRLRRILETLERISANVAQLSGACGRSGDGERISDETERFRREVLDLGAGIRAAFLESDRYWKFDSDNGEMS